MNTPTVSALAGVVQLPDIAGMNATLKSMQLFVRRETDSLGPAVQQRINQLLQMVEACDRSLAEQVLRGLVYLNNQPWDEVESEVLKIHQDQSLTAEQRRMAEVSFQQVVEHDGQRTVLELRGQLEQFQAQLRELERFTLEDAADQLEGLTLQLRSLAASVDGAQQSLERQQKVKEDLDAVINAFADPSLSRQFRNLIPTEEVIEQAVKLLTLTEIDADVLKSASKTLDRHIGLVAEGRKYGDVVAARDRLRLEIQDRQRELKAWLARQAALQAQVHQWQALPRLSALKQQWIAEASRVPMGLTVLLDGFKTRLTFALMVEGLNQVAGFLGAVRKLQENA